MRLTLTETSRGTWTAFVDGESIGNSAPDLHPLENDADLFGMIGEFYCALDITQNDGVMFLANEIGFGIVGNNLAE